LWSGVAWGANAGVAPEWAVRRIQDAGLERTFEIAPDELSVAAPDGGRETRSVAAADSLAVLRRRAAAVAAATGEETELVLYEAGQERNRYTRRVLTRQVLVLVQPGTDPAALAAAAGAAAAESFGFAPEHYLFSATEAGGALDLADRLRALPGVESADPLLARQQRKKWTPNDTLFSQQWHLVNTGQSGGTAGIDVKITNVWDTYRGSGILIGIVDDGLQLTHTDLVQNVNTVLDWDWNGNDADPSPNIANEDFHGTSCAGVAAARGNNGRGVSGAAPEATLVGYRLIGGVATDTMEASAMTTNNHLVPIKSNSWGPNDDGKTLEAPGTLTRAALSNAATTGRGGRGTILVWAGGNGLDASDNSNYDGYANSIYTIAVAALTDGGAQSWYSEPGANLVVTAPSSGGATDIVTTDLMGNDGYNYAGAAGELADKNYTKTFGGTSSSTPLVSGILALVLEANPNLGWRDVQEILIRSATKNAPTDTDWRTNSAGFTFNHKYGSGLANARAAVTLATNNWVNLGPQVQAAVVQTNLNRAIPDNNAGGITQSFALAAANLRVEHVTVTVDIRHLSRGHLALTLTSPSGMQSRLAEKRADTGDHYSGWTFSSVRHWGEEAQGTWTLQAADLTAGTVGTLRWARVEFYGTALAPASNQPPALAPIGAKSVVASNALSFGVSAADPVDGDSVRLWATNVPAWASFPGATNAGSATATFSGTPVAAGAHTVYFFAADKDGTNTEAVVVTVTEPGGGGGGSSYIADFEDTSKGSYATGAITNNGVVWTLNDAVVGTAAGSDRFNGLKSARIRSNETANAGMLTMNADTNMGLSAITLYHARYGSDGSSTGRVDYSVNGGANWTSAGTFVASETNLTLFTATNLNVTGNVRVRVVKTAGGASQRMNVDDITLYPYGGGGGGSTAPAFGANPGPVAATVGQAASFSVSVSGMPAPVLALQGTTASAGYNFTAGTGELAYQPPLADVGGRTFTFTASNSAGVATQTVSVTVSSAGGGGAPLDMGGYKLKQYNAALTYTIPVGTTVEPGGYLIVARSASKAQFEAAWGVALGGNVTFINSTNKMPQLNGAEQYELLDAGNILVDGVTPASIDPANSSVQRTNLFAAASEAGAWLKVAQASATPGTGVAGNGTAGLRISEYSDAASWSNEFIEIHYDASAGGGGLPPTVNPIGSKTVLAGRTLDYMHVTATDGRRCRSPMPAPAR
jgi:subtilisin-like proprotein convertase family protein